MDNAQSNEQAMHSVGPQAVINPDVTKQPAPIDKVGTSPADRDILAVAAYRLEVDSCAHSLDRHFENCELLTQGSFRPTLSDQPNINDEPPRPSYPPHLSSL